MVIVGAIILPHGAMTLDPSKPGLPAGAPSLHTAALKASKEMADLNPSLIVLSTPHGLCLNGKFGVYLNDRASGSGEWNGEWGEFTADVQLAPSKARQLVDFWNDNGVPAEGITAFSNTNAPLRWGEAIPLWFLKKGGCSAPVLLVSQPGTSKGSSSADRAQFASSDEFQRRQLLAGRQLQAFLNTHARDERVVVAISGDLSHTHAHSCTDPLYGPGPRWPMLGSSSPAAIPFDEAVTKWASTLDCQPLLDEARSRVSEALVCGYSGFVMLHAALCGESEEREPPQWTGEVLACCAPTYYGMIVAKFLPKAS